MCNSTWKGPIIAANLLIVGKVALPTPVRWVNAATWAENAAAQGWRIPTLEEMRDLVENGNWMLFNVPENIYWTKDIGQDGIARQWAYQVGHRNRQVRRTTRAFHEDQLAHLMVVRAVTQDEMNSLVAEFKRIEAEDKEAGSKQQLEYLAELGRQGISIFD